MRAISGPNADLIRRFNSEMQSIYDRAKAIGYNAIGLTHTTRKHTLTNRAQQEYVRTWGRALAETQTR